MSCAPSALGLSPELEACGLDLAGVLTADRYDELVPAAWRSQQLLAGSRFVYVIGSAGSSFYRYARAQRPDSAHPLDETCEECVTEAGRRLEAAGALQRPLFYWERRGPGERGFADFVAIAHAAGFGARSRIGMLLHPTHGPWFAIRALLLCDRQPPPSIEAPAVPDFCADCAAPCIDACPAGAVGAAGIDIERCSESRHRDPRCAARCDARLACPVGRDSRYADDALEHHMTAHFREG